MTPLLISNTADDWLSETIPYYMYCKLYVRLTLLVEISNSHINAASKDWFVTEFTVP